MVSYTLLRNETRTGYSDAGIGSRRADITFSHPISASTDLEGVKSMLQLWKRKPITDSPIPSSPSRMSGDYSRFEISFESLSLSRPISPSPAKPNAGCSGSCIPEISTMLTWNKEYQSCGHAVSHGLYYFLSTVSNINNSTETWRREGSIRKISEYRWPESCSQDYIVARKHPVAYYSALIKKNRLNQQRFGQGRSNEYFLDRTKYSNASEIFS